MATLEQIQAHMKKLQTQADALIAKKAQAAVDQIRELMIKHGLTTADIEARAKVKRDANAATGRVANVKIVKPAASAKGKLPPKYRNAKTGETWSGYARPPAWIKDVKDRSKFLIASGTDTALATVARTGSKAKAAAKRAAAVAGATANKGQRKGPQPAKYLDPKTGATWSGRGPAPTWLAAAKDRAKFLIDGGDTAATATGVAARKAAAKKVVVRKAPITERKKAAKKATVPAAKKPATRKITSKKLTTAKAIPATDNVAAAGVAAAPVVA